jgi:DNA-directed RNA polymerase subunit alpha
VTAIILNLKDLVLKIEEEGVDAKVLELDVTGPKAVTASDFVLPYGVTVINPDLVLANVTEGGHIQNARYAATAAVTSPAKATKPTVIPPSWPHRHDSNYSPVTKSVQHRSDRVGHDSRYDKLTLEFGLTAV